MTIANLGSPNLVSTSLEYPKHDVLAYKQLQIKRLANLLKAITLDGHVPTPVCIQIEATDRCFVLFGRIVSVLDHQVRLDGGDSIPLRCIVSVEFP